MQKLTWEERKHIRQTVRMEWFSLYLLDEHKKTRVVRQRMRSLYTQFMEAQ